MLQVLPFENRWIQNPFIGVSVTRAFYALNQNGILDFGDV